MGFTLGMVAKSGRLACPKMRSFESFRDLRLPDEETLAEALVSGVPGLEDFADTGAEPFADAICVGFGVPMPESSGDVRNFLKSCGSPGRLSSRTFCTPCSAVSRALF